MSIPRNTPPPPPPAPPPMPSGLPARPGSAQPPVGAKFAKRSASKPSGACILLYAVEGWGKTSMMVYAPGAYLITGRGEEGYDALLQSGRVPDIPVTTATSWTELIGTLQGVLAEPPEDMKMLVLDSATSLERMCHAHICAKNFEGNWAEKFMAFHKGYEFSVNEWNNMLALLREIANKGVHVSLIGHAAQRKATSPEGFEWASWEMDCHKKTSQATYRWADDIIFGKFRSEVASKGGNKIGIGGQDRVIYAECHDQYVAKSRHGIPSNILMPNDPSQTWGVIAPYINKGAAT